MMRMKLVLGMVLGLLGSGASAQEVANNSAFGDWVVRCEAVTTTQTSCRLVQVLSRAEDDTLVARFIGFPGAGDSTVVLAQVPMGVFLPGGAVFRAENAPEDAPQYEMVWQRCLGQICEAAIALTPEDVAGFTEAGALLFGYRMQLNADPIIVRVDVSQFADAIAVIAPKQTE